MSAVGDPVWAIFGAGFAPGRYTRDPRVVHLLDERSRLPRPRCGSRGGLVRRATPLDLQNLRRCRNCSHYLET